MTPPPPAPDELGILLKEYRPKRWALRLGIAVAVFLTGVAIIVYYVNTREVIEEVTEERNEVRTYARYTVPEPIRHAGDWMAVLGAFAVLYYLVWTLRTLNLRVAVHERGFVYRRWFRRIACPWTDIAKVYYFRQRQALVFSWTTYYCSVVRRDGRRITLPSPLTKLIAGMGPTYQANLFRLVYSIIVHVVFRNPLPGVAELCDVIRRNVTELQLPSAWQALHRGEQVNLGDALALAPQGLLHDGTMLPWRDLTSISVGGGVGVTAGMIRFQRRGGDGFALHSYTVANRDVLLAIARRRYHVTVQNHDGDDIRLRE